MASNANPAYKKIDPCALVTEQEAEAILGRGLEPPRPQGNFDCWYLREGGNDFGDVEVITSVAVDVLRSPAEFDAQVAKGIHDLNASLKAAGGATSELERVNGVGDGAFYAAPSLFVLRNGRMISVVASKPIAVAFAGKAVPRMP